MVMQRWDPIRDIRRMQEMMDRMWRGGIQNAEALEVGAWTLPMDVIETNDNVIVRTAVPGVAPEEIDISVEDNLLTISAERRQQNEQQEQGRYLVRESIEGSFQRSIRLPNIIDPDRAESTCDNGMLTITFPKQEQKKAKRIEVRGGGQQQLGEGREQQAA